MVNGQTTASVGWILGVDELPAHIDPDRPALLWGRHRRTYAELRERALRLAAGLRGLGCEPGDRVGTFLLSVPTFLAGGTLAIMPSRGWSPQRFAALVDDEGRPLPPGSVGEVWTAGPSVTAGFLGRPELTAEALHDGWLATGDLGRLDDDDGYLYIEGRKKDMIISSSQNLYPAEIENGLSHHAELVNWTVIGVPDEKRGEAVCALVVPRSGSDVTADGAIDFVTENLSSYKKPKYVVFVDDLPGNPMGKVLKNQVRARRPELAASG